MTTLSAAVRSFLDEPHFAVVATIAPDGVPHQTVVWYVREGDEILFSVPQATVKHQHLQRDSRLSICMEDGFRYVTLIGTAALDEDWAAAAAQYAQVGRRYQGRVAAPQGPPSARSAELMKRSRVGIRMTVERVISQGVE
jgi:PPOX class probable F420-dependent enzyme